MEKINKTGNALFHCFITPGLGIVLAGILSSCSVIDWFAGRASDQEVKDMDKDISASMTAKKTPYDEALSQFGKMLDAYNITEVRVQSKVISNQTAEK
ncbi:MAG: hypothetical protein EOM14_14060, partial [Clostridia bacterium]|nr:hypothetical protein [Clostridia bacterium]